MKTIIHILVRKPWSTLGLLILSLAASATEVVGIGFLVPLLESINVGGGAASESRISRYLSEPYQLIGIPFVLGTIILGAFSLFVLHAILTYFRQALTGKLAP